MHFQPIYLKIITKNKGNFMQFLASDAIIFGILNRIFTCFVISSIGFLFLLITCWVIRTIQPQTQSSEDNRQIVFQIVVGSLPIGIALTLAGYMLGASRETVVGDIFPAFIALASGMLVYFFQRIRSNFVMLAFLILVGTLEIFTAATIGAAHREFSEKKARYIIIEEEVFRRNLMRNLEVD